MGRARTWTIRDVESVPVDQIAARVVAPGPSWCTPARPVVSGRPLSMGNRTSMFLVALVRELRGAPIRQQDLRRRMQDRLPGLSHNEFRQLLRSAVRRGWVAKHGGGWHVNPVVAGWIK